MFCTVNEETMEKDALITLKNIVKHFDISGSLLDQISFSKGRFSLEKTIVHAVNDVSFVVKKGETLSIVGESGCGKSTLARTIIGLYKPDSGEIFYGDTRLDTLTEKEWLPYRVKMQMVFQNPYASLNPRKRVQDILEEPIRYHEPHLSSAEVKEKVASVMEQVGINPLWANKLPHEFSGGQRQRISIARAIILKPECIIADEPISALDVSIQAQILNLLVELQDRYKLTYIFISHDLSVVEHISSRVAVMYIGSLCEMAPAKKLFEEPKHPYTKALLSAIPRVGSKGFHHISLPGDIPTPIHPPSGCAFHTRCHYADSRCIAEKPKCIVYDDNHLVACHAVEENRIE